MRWHLQQPESHRSSLNDMRQIVSEWLDSGMITSFSTKGCLCMCIYYVQRYMSSSQTSWAVCRRPFFKELCSRHGEIFSRVLFRRIFLQNIFLSPEAFGNPISSPPGLYILLPSAGKRSCQMRSVEREDFIPNAITVFWRWGEGSQSKNSKKNQKNTSFGDKINCFAEVQNQLRCFGNINNIINLSIEILKGRHGVGTTFSCKLRLAAPSIFWLRASKKLFQNPIVVLFWTNKFRARDQHIKDILPNSGENKYKDIVTRKK